MPWVTVSPSPSASRDPWVTVPSPAPGSPPPMPQPLPSFAETRARLPTGLTGFDFPAASPSGSWDFLRGLGQTTVDPIMGLLGNLFTLGKTGVKGYMGRTASPEEMAKLAEMQLGPEAGIRGMASDFTQATGSDMLGKLVELIAPHMPGVNVLGPPSVTAGKKMALGIMAGGDTGAKQFEEGAGNIAGLLLPTALDLIPRGVKAPTVEPAAAAGMDMKSLLANLFRTTATEATPEAAALTRNAQQLTTGQTETPLGAAQADLMHGMQVGGGGGKALGAAKVLPEEANAGLSLRDLFDKLRGRGATPEQIDLGRREFLKKIPAAAGAVAAKPGEAAVGGVGGVMAPTVGAHPYVDSIIKELGYATKSLEELAAEGAGTDELSNFLFEHASYGVRDLLDYSDEGLKKVMGADYSKVAPLVDRLKETFDLGYAADTVSPLMRPQPIDQFAAEMSTKYPGLTNQQVQDHLGAGKPIADLQTLSDKALKAAAPPPPTAPERLAARGIPKPELRVAPGEPAPRKMYNQEQLKLAPARAKLDQRANAGFDIVSPFKQAAANLEASKRPVPLTRSERTGSRVSGLLERAIEGSIPGAGPFQRFRDAQQEALGKLADATVSEISKFKGTAEEVGRQTQDALIKAQEGLKSQAGEMYAHVDDLAQGVSVKTAAMKAFAKDLQKEMRAEGKLVPAKAMERARAVVDRIARAPQSVSFSVAQAAKSDLAAMARATGDLIPGKAGGVAKKMTNMLDTAMVDAAAASNKPELVQALRQANSLWKETTTTFNDSVIAKTLKADPEKAHAILAKAPLEDLRRAKKLLPPETMQAVKARVVRDMLDQATQGELAKTMFPAAEQAKLGVTQPKAAQPQLRGPSLKKALERMGEDRLKELFSEKELKGIYAVAETADRVGNKQGGWIPQILNYPLVFGAIRGATGSPSAAVGTGAAAVGINALARIMTKPWGASVIKEYLNASSVAGPRAAFWGARMGDLMSGEIARQKREQAKKPRPAPSPSPSPRQ